MEKLEEVKLTSLIGKTIARIERDKARQWQLHFKDVTGNILFSIEDSYMMFDQYGNYFIVDVD